LTPVTHQLEPARAVKPGRPAPEIRVSCLEMGGLARTCGRATLWHPQRLSRRRGHEEASVSEQIRVVIVDDISETREHLTKLLSFESDIQVVGTASSGDEAVELAGKLAPDILLMDINMPGMDGIATTNASRRPSQPPPSS